MTGDACEVGEHGDTVGCGDRSPYSQRETARHGKQFDVEVTGGPWVA